MKHVPDTLNLLEVLRTDATIAVNDMDHTVWGDARLVQLTRYWSGEEAPPGRQAEARVLCTATALHVRFVCQQHEPLVVSIEPQTVQKTIGLWERDVCELFVAPDANEPQHYYEFETAPTGEWLDLAVRQMPDKRETNWNYSSGMTVATRIESEKVTIAMRIPLEAFGRVPRTGDRWRANILRCIGIGEERGYLAWQPTFTERPNFHVPEAFGWLSFIE